MSSTHRLGSYHQDATVENDPPTSETDDDLKDGKDVEALKQGDSKQYVPLCD